MTAAPREPRSRTLYSVACTGRPASEERRASPSDRYAVQGTLALDLAGPPVRPATHSDEELRRWAARFAQALVEVVGGQRPVTQLLRWTTRDVFRDVERRTRVLQRAAGTPVRTVAPARRRPHVVSTHLCRPRPEVAEVSVHVRHAARSRALAMRLELRQGRWLCSVLEFG